MHRLKRISEHAVPRALDKAERYRLLNEPSESESICLDVLEIDPDNERARITLILALSDQFPDKLTAAFPRAQELVGGLESEYARAYYGAILCERRARALRGRGGTHSAAAAFEWLERALDGYARAIELRPSDADDEAVLRWNTCVRMLESDSSLKPAAVETFRPLLE